MPTQILPSFTTLQLHFISLYFTTRTHYSSFSFPSLQFSCSHFHSVIRFQNPSYQFVFFLKTPKVWLILIFFSKDCVILVLSMAYVTDHSDPTGRTARVPVDSSPNFIDPYFVHIYHLQQLYRARLARRSALIAQIELKRSITLQQVTDFKNPNSMLFALVCLFFSY